MPRKINFIRLILCIIICEAAGIIGSFFTISSISAWYQNLNKPFFSPPNFLFGPVWLILYFLMGVSLYLVWNSKKDKKWFWIQLFLNFIWSIAFFGLRNPILGFAVIVLLLISIFITIKSFYKINKTSSYLLIPYFAWVSFATLLNLAIVILNN